MSSYISHFRPFAAALLVLVAIEAVASFIGRPNPFDKTNFLQFSFAKPETPQRLFMYHKIREFADSGPVIVQSGDSSGFYGIEPAVVMSHLPAGTTYLNMSCCANLGFKGYYNTMKLMADHNPSIRYMVLHFTPYTMPRAEMWDDDGAALWGDSEIKVFGDAVYDEFMGPWRIFQLPTMAWRRAISDYFFYAGGVFSDPERPLLDNANYLEFLKVFRQSLGWMPETDVRVSVPDTECTVPAPSFFDWTSLRRKTYLEEVLDSFAALAADKNATLVVVFQPVACAFGRGVGSEEARAVIDAFKIAHPDVEIPFPLIETWPSDKFSVPAHVKAEYTDEIGNRLGEAMAEIMARRGG
jgi:hypothetical protein